MAWPTNQTASDKLDLTGSYQTVQESSADMEITIPPGEVLNLLFRFDTGTGDEVAQILIVRGLLDGTTDRWESDEEAPLTEWMEHTADSTTYYKMLVLAGINSVKIRVRSRDSDDTVGSETDQDFYVYYKLDGGV